MTEWIYIDLFVLLCVVTLTGLIIPQILLIAFRKKLFDIPDERKIHKAEVPRLGGIAFFPSILFALLLLFGFASYNDSVEVLSQVDDNFLKLCFLGCATIIMYLTGMADDLIGVRYRAKFIMQTFAAGFICFGGIRIENLYGLLGIHEVPLAVSIALTILLIVFIINAINLIDGIDGLASGLSATASLFYAFVFLKGGSYINSVLATATLGALLSFFCFNVFGNPNKHKKIFMGDTGALIIGLLLGMMSIDCCSIARLQGGSNSAVIAFAPLLIPGFDVVRVYLHRIRAHRDPFLPDKSHIHHKLLALGLTQRKAMLLIILVSFLLISLNFYLSDKVDINWLFFGDLMIWTLANIVLTYFIRRREQRMFVVLYE